MLKAGKFCKHCKDMVIGKCFRLEFPKGKMLKHLNPYFKRKSKAIHLTFERLPPLGEIPLMGVIKIGRQYTSYLNAVTQDIFGM